MKALKIMAIISFVLLFIGLCVASSDDAEMIGGYLVLVSLYHIAMSIVAVTLPKKPYGKQD